MNGILGLVLFYFIFSSLFWLHYFYYPPHFSLAIYIFSFLQHPSNLRPQVSKLQAFNMISDRRHPNAPCLLQAEFINAMPMNYSCTVVLIDNCCCVASTISQMNSGWVLLSSCGGASIRDDIETWALTSGGSEIHLLACGPFTGHISEENRVDFFKTFCCFFSPL